MTPAKELEQWLHQSQKQAATDVVRAEYALERAREKLAMLERLNVPAAGPKAL